jgi:hypothetical protein
LTRSKNCPWMSPTMDTGAGTCSTLGSDRRTSDASLSIRRHASFEIRPSCLQPRWKQWRRRCGAGGTVSSRERLRERSFVRAGSACAQRADEQMRRPACACGWLVHSALVSDAADAAMQQHGSLEMFHQQLGVGNLRTLWVDVFHLQDLCAIAAEVRVASG